MRVSPSFQRPAPRFLNSPLPTGWTESSAGWHPPCPPAGQSGPVGLAMARGRLQHPQGGGAAVSHPQRGLATSGNPESGLRAHAVPLPARLAHLISRP